MNLGRLFYYKNIVVSRGETDPQIWERELRYYVGVHRGVKFAGLEDSTNGRKHSLMIPSVSYVSSQPIINLGLSGFIKRPLGQEAARNKYSVSLA